MTSIGEFLQLPVVASALVAAGTSYLLNRLQHRGTFQNKLYDAQILQFRTAFEHLADTHDDLLDELVQIISKSSEGELHPTQSDVVKEIRNSPFVLASFRFEQDLYTPPRMQDAIADYRAAMFIIIRTIGELLQQGHYEQANLHIIHHGRQPIFRLASEIRHILKIQEYMVSREPADRKLGIRILHQLRIKSPASSSETQEYFAALRKLEAFASTIELEGKE